MGMFTVGIDPKGRRVQFKECKGNDWCKNFNIGETTDLEDGVFSGVYEDPKDNIFDCLVVVKDHIIVEITPDLEGTYSQLKKKYDL